MGTNPSRQRTAAAGTARPAAGPRPTPWSSKGDFFTLPEHAPGRPDCLGVLRDRALAVALNFSDKFSASFILPLPALVAKWQTRTLEVRVG
jgi:hypothetical protein